MCTDKCSLHEIGLAPGSPGGGLRGSELLLMHKRLSLGHKHQPPGPRLRGRPLAPKGHAQNLHVVLRKPEPFNNCLLHKSETKLFEVIL